MYVRPSSASRGLMYDERLDRSDVRVTATSASGGLMWCLERSDVRVTATSASRGLMCASLQLVPREVSCARDCADTCPSWAWTK